MARIEVKTKQEAWEMVDQIFPTDYSEDPGSRERAGYPIYRSPIEYYDYICDLGCRLEINLKQGNRTINIWIAEEEEPEVPELPSSEDIKEAASNQYTFEPEMVQLVRVFVSGGRFDSEASQRVYKTMRKVADDRCWLYQIASDVVVGYCEDKGIEWGCIRVLGVSHHDHAEKGRGIMWSRPSSRSALKVEKEELGLIPRRRKRRIKYHGTDYRVPAV